MRKTHPRSFYINYLFKLYVCVESGKAHFFYPNKYFEGFYIFRKHKAAMAFPGT